MSEMVERVAQAIYKSLKGSLEASGLRPCLTDETEWREFIPDARAAIAEMREPTKAMVDAMPLGWNETESGGPSYDDEWAAAFRSAINAALK